MAEVRPMAYDAKEPHPVSLKVLRLSRPSLESRSPLPRRTSPDLPYIAPNYAITHAIPFVLSPTLLLPAAFGPAYVGEIFSCTVCANNELSTTDPERRISAVRVAAEMQTPSQTIPIELGPAPIEGDDGPVPFQPGQTLQKMIRFDLKEAGNHVLAITVTYTETFTPLAPDAPDAPAAGGPASGGRVRTFRKLYQFLAQPGLAVRTKTAEVPPRKGSAPTHASKEASQASEYLLEAQLENLTHEAMTLESVNLAARAPLQSTSLNWDVSRPDEAAMLCPTLNPREVLQVAFLLTPLPPDTGKTKPEPAAKDEARTLGQLNIEWRSAMGERGLLSTGWLTFRRR
ncbi:MAG: hypothetical protein M1826_005807 [Phylliscum demangeonii]|nr:MAG: hypothetical protein M1826_005807 [Phylliscum demangeonii]